MAVSFLGRKSELQRFDDFIHSNQSGFMFLRGRRRIGKTWLLKHVTESDSAFFFQGDDDSSTRQLMKKMAVAWKDYSGDDSLSIIRIVDLSWERIFNGMTRHFRDNPEQPQVIILDEIQWIAKRKSGFLSQLKEAWVDWEQLGNVKIVICGSSHRFFADKTSAETSVLHRMRTTSDLWIYPFSPAEIHKHWFPHWTHEQIFLVFMMTGGVPYYLERIPKQENFIRAINQTFFTRDTIFLDEPKEVINLEFTKGSAPTVEKILSSLGQEGSTLNNICLKSGIKSESTVRSMVDQLLEFGIVVEKTQAGIHKGNRRGSKFYLKDPFLNFYFQVLREMSPKIRKNADANLFSECIGSKSGYYIANYTGKAFELATEWILRQELSPPGQERIFERLKLVEQRCEVGHFWIEGKTQVDLIVENPTDRETRLIELKWISSPADLSSGYVAQVKDKPYSPPKGWTISYHLLLSADASDSLHRQASEQGVQILGLQDLIGTSETEL